MGIWANFDNPLGTGKTTVVVKTLRKLFKTLDDEEKILMTASTHNGILFHKALTPPDR